MLHKIWFFENLFVGYTHIWTVIINDVPFRKMSRHMSVRQILALDIVVLEKLYKFLKSNSAVNYKFWYLWYVSLTKWRKSGRKDHLRSKSGLPIFDSRHFKEIRLTTKLYLTTVRSVFKHFIRIICVPESYHLKIKISPFFPYENHFQAINAFIINQNFISKSGHFWTIQSVRPFLTK